VPRARCKGSSRCSARAARSFNSYQTEQRPFADQSPGIRAEGYGLGGILTPTGIGTIVEEGKQRILVDSKPFLLETALRADFALVQAFAADYVGNLHYVLTARNFNPVIAMAADTVMVEAENIVPVGVIAPDHVMTPAPIVDYLIASE